MVDPALVEANRDLAAWLKEQARPADPGSPWQADGWELHTHPDVADRLRELAPPGTFRHMYGVAVLVHANGAIFAFGPGMNGISVRDFIPTPGGVRTRQQWPALHGWMTVEPWPVDIEMKLGTTIMAQFMSHVQAAMS